MGYPGTKGQRRIAALAESKGFHLYRGDSFGCAPVWIGEEMYQAYSILRDEPRDGFDPKMQDSYLVLCRVTLAQAERYLTDSEVPDGHTLYELSPFEK